jgi:DNA-binding CsgD family transcriptional regulator
MVSSRFPSERVLEIINAADSCLKPQPVREKILDLFFDCCRADGAVFFLPDGGSGFTNTFSKNFCERSDREFGEYYCHFDPLLLFYWNQDGSYPTVRVISYDSYMSTEYYCDFLRPYGIHYKLVVYLKAREGLQGKVVLTRPRGSPIFSPCESTLASELSSYMAYALEHNALVNKIRSQRPEDLREEKLMEVFRLSRREIEVVECLFKGMRNADIARTLFVSEITVKKHLQNIYAKIGVKSRTALISRVLGG